MNFILMFMTPADAFVGFLKEAGWSRQYQKIGELCCSIEELTSLIIMVCEVCVNCANVFTYN